MTELDLPVLEINVPEYLLSRKMNLNYNIRLTLKYPDADPDKLFYSSVFLYNLDAVAVLIFEYLDFRFKIWESFSDLNSNNNHLDFRCSVYNPLYIMPSQSSISFEINIPPS